MIEAKNDPTAKFYVKWEPLHPIDQKRIHSYAKSTVDVRNTKENFLFDRRIALKIFKLSVIKYAPNYKSYLQVI